MNADMLQPVLGKNRGDAFAHREAGLIGEISALRKHLKEQQEINAKHEKKHVQLVRDHQVALQRLTLDKTSEECQVETELRKVISKLSKQLRQAKSENEGHFAENQELAHDMAEIQVKLVARSLDFEFVNSENIKSRTAVGEIVAISAKIEQEKNVAEEQAKDLSEQVDMLKSKLEDMKYTMQALQESFTREEPEENSNNGEKELIIQALTRRLEILETNVSCLPEKEAQVIKIDSLSTKLTKKKKIEMYQIDGVQGVEIAHWKSVICSHVVELSLYKFQMEGPYSHCLQIEKVHSDMCSLLRFNLADFKLTDTKIEDLRDIVSSRLFSFRGNFILFIRDIKYLPAILQLDESDTDLINSMVRMRNRKDDNATKRKVADELCFVFESDFATSQGFSNDKAKYFCKFGKISATENVIKKIKVHAMKKSKNSPVPPIAKGSLRAFIHSGREIHQ